MAVKRPSPPRRRVLQSGGRLSYPRGINTFVADEDVPEDQLRYASDARMNELGQYATKKGMDFYTQAAGEAQDADETSTTGADAKAVTTTTWLAITFQPTTTGRLTKVDLNAYIPSAATGALRVDIYDDNSGEPGTLLASGGILNSEISGSATYETAYYVEAPQVTSGTDYWIVVYTQDNGSGSYAITSTTNTATSLASTDSGNTWASTGYNLNFKTYISTDSPTLGAYRAYKSDATKKTLMAHGTNLYTVNDLTGALTSIKSGLSSSATDYYFTEAQDVVYYVNGYDNARKWDFTTESAMSGISAVSSAQTMVVLHYNRLWFVDASDQNKVFWSNKAPDYETFTSTDFVYVPTSKHEAPITALQPLNGTLYAFTEQSKWAIYGDDISVLDVAQSPGIKGTYHQKAVNNIRNNLYFVSNDGAYRFDGTSDNLISAEVTDIIRGISDKSKIRTAAKGNRWYIFYPSSGSAFNDRCLVYNLDYEIWESIDLDTYVSAALNFNSQGDNDELVLFSNLVGQGFYAEEESNLYHNAGKPLQFEVRTRYDLLGFPDQKKQIKRLYPRFKEINNTYDVNIYYDFDYNNSPNLLTTLDLVGGSATWGGGETWGGGATWGSTQFKDKRLSVPGWGQAIQRRYVRTGTNTPVWFAGETWHFKTRRSK